MGFSNNAGNWRGRLHLGPDGTRSCLHRQQSDEYEAQQRMLHENVLATTRRTDFGGVTLFFEGHGEFSLERLCVARSRLIRRRGTVAIKPEARRQIYYTMVSIDSLVSIRATNAFSLERICRHMRHADPDFGEPIRKSNCALAWSVASSCYGVLPRKYGHE